MTCLITLAITWIALCTQKRLAIGIIATLGLGAFGLIPTEQLRLKPEKPMYFYIVPLLRIKVIQ